MFHFLNNQVCYETLAREWESSHCPGLDARELKEAQCIQTMCRALSSPLTGGGGEFTTGDLFKYGYSSSGSLA